MLLVTCAYGGASIALNHSAVPPPSRFPPIPATRRQIRCKGAARRLVVSAEGVAESSATKKILVLGGSGRVGRSTCLSLAKILHQEAGTPGVAHHLAESEIVIGGRNRDKGEAVCSELRDLTPAVPIRFVSCDIDDAASLTEAVRGSALIIHTAGPFQRKGSCSVLEASIACGTPYIDVCDDMEYSKQAKALHADAKAAGVPSITTAGIYPGVSNLMAAELVRLNKTSAQGEVVGKDKEAAALPDKLRFSYYTAGSGGAGPTILATSFLLLGEPAGVFVDGEFKQERPYSMHRVVDFGPGIGRRSTYLLNIPEVASAHEVLGVPSVSARFGTSPEFWNWTMEAMVSLLPRSILQDRQSVSSLVQISDPLVRVVDSFSGEAVGMRVDLTLTNGRVASSLYSHAKLSESVGQCTAAFALAMLDPEKLCQAGVWFPEEEEAIPWDKRGTVLALAGRGTKRFLMNKAPWQLETPPTQIGFGFYM